MTSPSLKSFSSPVSISHITRPKAKNIYPNPVSASFNLSNPRLSLKSPRCINMRLGSMPNSQTHEILVSSSTETVDSPLAITTVTTADKVRLLASEFRSLSEPIDRVKRLLLYAAALPQFDELARIPTNRVNGCTTQVWLDVKMDEFGMMRFRADSDSEISKGFCSCLIWILDGATAEEVVAVRMEDLSEMNVGVHGKAKSRVNTWQNVLIAMQKRTVAAQPPSRSPSRLCPLPTPSLATVEAAYVKGVFMDSDHSISMLPLYYDYSI